MKKGTLITVVAILIFGLMFLYSLYSNPPELPDEHRDHQVQAEQRLSG